MSSWDSLKDEAEASMNSLTEQKPILSLFSATISDQPTSPSDSFRSTGIPSYGACGSTNSFQSGISGGGGSISSGAALVPRTPVQLPGLNCQQQQQAIQRLLTRHDLEKWASISESMSVFNGLISETLRTNRLNQERIRKIEALAARLMRERHITPIQAYEEAGNQIGGGDLAGSSDGAHDLYANIMLQVTNVIEVSEFSHQQQHVLMTGLPLETLVTGTPGSHMASLFENLAQQNHSHLYLVGTHLQHIIALMQQAMGGGLTPQNIYHAQFNHQAITSGEQGSSFSPVLLNGVNDMAQAIVQNFEAVPLVPTLTVVALGGIYSPFNGHNIMVVTIPSGDQVVTILMSPVFGVIATESHNSQAIAEYLYRLLGLLVTTGVTDSVMLASAPLGGTGMFAAGAQWIAGLCHWMGQLLVRSTSDEDRQKAIGPGAEKKYLKDKKDK